MTPTILITGGSSGIGLALSKRYAAKGWRLLWASLDEAEIEAAKAEILTAQPDAEIEALAIDLSAPDAPASLAAWAEGAGGADVVVNNAGLGVYGRSGEIPLEAEQRMIAVNIAALHALSRLMLPQLEARSAEPGREAVLVNIASNSAFTPLPYLAVYAATKAFVKHYTEALSLELREAGSKVRAVTICPAAVKDTPFKARADMDGVRTFDSFTATTAEEVAQDIEHAIETGKTVRISGARMRAAYLFMKIAPAALVRAITRREVEKA